jgi:GT2 family glycosyltransferase
MLVSSHTDPALVNSLGVAFDEHGAGVDVGDGRWAADVDTEPVDIEMFTGGAVVMTAAFLDATGGFDPRYFLYYEDVDLALRGRLLGWSYRLAPASVVDHRREGTTAGDPGRTRYLRERNRLWVAFRFAGPRHIVAGVWLSLRRLRHRPRATHAAALVAGLAGAPRRLWERRSASAQMP